MPLSTQDRPAQSAQPRWALLLCSAAFFMVCLDALVVGTALPRIQETLHSGFASLQWTVNAYNIAIAAGTICAAAIGDRYGRRRVFVLGLALFTIASAACALAPSATVLIGARTVQGLGGAVILPLSLTILSEAFPAEKRAGVLGVYGGLAGLAVAAGPIVGGAVTQGINWHWIFWINVPIGLAVVALAVLFLAETHGRPVPLDLCGVALIALSLVAIVWSLVRVQTVGWASAQTVATLSVGLLSGIAFVLWEARVAHPLLSLQLLRVPAFAAGNAAAFCAMGAISAGAFLTTQYFQFALGYSPLAAGVRLLPFFATPMIVAPLAGKASARVGLRPLIVAGMLLLAAGFAYVAVTASVQPTYGAMVAALFVAGVGVSMTLPTIPTAVLGAVPPADAGTASGTNNMLQRFGAVFGVAIASSVFSANGHLGSPLAFTDGFGPGVAVAAVLAALGAVAGMAVPRPVRGRNPVEPELSVS